MQFSLRSPHFHNKWVQLSAWVLLGVLGLWLVGWLGLPPLLKNQLQSRGSEALGRAVTVGSVAFKPWTLELTISDLAIATQEGSGSQLSIKRLYIDAEMESLFRLAPVVKAFSLDSPSLRLTHLGGGRYDIDDVIQKLVPEVSDAPKKPQGAETPSEGLAPFALFNLALNQGSVDFVDQAVNQTHQLRALNIGIPFLNNLPSQREVVTEPHLAFQLNGSSFDSAAQSTPFAPSRKTDASIQLTNFDLKPYLGYLPPDLPLQLVSAELSADVKLAFEQTSPPTVQLSGRLELVNAEVRDLGSQALLSFDSFVVAVDELRPLASLARLSEVSLNGAVVELRRDKAGLLNGLQLGEPSGGVAVDLAGNAAGGATDDSTTNGAMDEAASETGATTQAAVAAPDASGKPSEKSHEGRSPWAIEVAKLHLRDATVNWTDEATAAAPARLGLHQLNVEASDIAWPMAQPMRFNGAAQVVGLPLTAQSMGAGGAGAQSDARAGVGTDVGQGAALKFSGTATDQAAQVTVALEQLPLILADPYLAELLKPKLDGQLSTELEVQWAASGTVALAVKQLTLDSLALLPRVEAKGEATQAAPLASILSLAVTDAQIDLNENKVVMGRLAVVNPQVSVGRSKDQRWMFESWLLDSEPTPPDEPPAKRWTLLIKDATLDKGAVAFEDLALPGKPVKLSVSGLKLAMKNTTLEGANPEPFHLSGQIKGPRGEPGEVNFNGSLAWAPLAVQGSLLLDQLPLQAVEPYLSDVLNVQLLRADAGFKGELHLAQGPKGISTKIAGDVALEELRANSLPGGGTGDLKIADELLSWKTLSLRGLQVAMAPEEALKVDLKETVLSDFYARVIVDPTGRINLQNLLKPTAAELAESAAPAATDPATPSPAKPAETAADAGPVPVINLGPASLINGRVFFSDRFVKPNYSVNLSELTGKLGAFSSVAPQGAPQLADLELRGRAEGTATLEILGKVNPLATPLALEITANMRDLELPPLSPYSAKYSGYGIERGKLNLTVGYRIAPNGTLTATNNLVLNQLTFGDKDEGSTESLPVKLAVALLADRHGVIDISLPVTGSLNDPQFSLAGVIGKVILNLITKAVTAPFSMLVNALGAEAEALSVVGFAPGSSALSAEAQTGLDKVAQALVDRPALKVTVVGTSSLQAEREGYKQERLKSLLLAEKRRAVVVAGQDGAAVTTVTPAENPALLKAVYKRADFPKPINALGIAQVPPDGEMRALLLASISVNEDLMRALAVQRGVVVKDYLASKQLPLERLFLGAVKPVVADGDWTPRADLSLDTK